MNGSQADTASPADPHARAAAEARVAEMTRLLQVASHELRTPLSAVKGYASTLIDYGDRLEEQEREDYRAGILSAAHQLEMLVCDILTFSRMEGGVFELNRTTVLLGAFISRAMESHRIASPTHDFHVLGPEPDIEVAVDTVRFLQVIDNLLENALLHGAPPVTIEVRDDGERAVISVTDAGPGVPEDALQTIFQPFVRVGNAARDAKGTGLGLSVCKGIVEKHGGSIWKERPQHGGCSIKFALPLWSIPR